MVKHMLRTNLITLDKKTFCLESLFAFLLHEDSFTKKMTTLCRWPFCSVQPSRAEFNNSTDQDFHSNWGMFTVAKCEVIFHDTQYFLWKKALCLCFMLYHCDQQWYCHRTRGSQVFIVSTIAHGNSGQPFIPNELWNCRTYILSAITSIDAFLLKMSLNFRVLCPFVAGKNPIGLNDAG